MSIWTTADLFWVKTHPDPSAVPSNAIVCRKIALEIAAKIQDFWMDRQVGMVESLYEMPTCDDPRMIVVLKGDLSKSEMSSAAWTGVLAETQSIVSQSQSLRLHQEAGFFHQGILFLLTSSNVDLPNNRKIFDLKPFLPKPKLPKTAVPASEEKQPSPLMPPKGKSIPNLTRQIKEACAGKRKEITGQLMQHLMNPQLQPNHWLHILGFVVSRGMLNRELFQRLTEAYARIGANAFDEDQRAQARQHLDQRFGSALTDNDPVFLRTLFEWMSENGFMENEDQIMRAAERVFERFLQLRTSEALTEARPVILWVALRTKNTSFLENLWKKFVASNLPDFQLAETFLSRPVHGSKLLPVAKSFFEKVLSSPTCADQAFQLLFKLAGAHRENQVCMAALDAWLYKALEGKSEKIVLFAQDIKQHTSLTRTNQLLQKPATSIAQTASTNPNDNGLKTSPVLLSKTSKTLDQAKTLLDAFAELDVFHAERKSRLKELQQFMKTNASEAKSLLALIDDLVKKNEEQIGTPQVSLANWQSVADLMDLQVFILTSMASVSKKTLKKLVISMQNKFNKNLIALPDHIRLWDNLVPLILDAPFCDDLLQDYRSIQVVEVYDPKEELQANRALALRGGILLGGLRKKFQKSSNLKDLERMVSEFKELLEWSRSKQHPHIFPGDIFEEVFLVLHHMANQGWDLDAKYRDEMHSLFQVLLSDPDAIKWVFTVEATGRKILSNTTLIQYLPIKGDMKRYQFTVEQEKKLQLHAEEIKKKLQNHQKQAEQDGINLSMIFTQKNLREKSSSENWKILGELYWKKKYQHQAVNCFLRALDGNSPSDHELQDLHQRVAKKYYVLGDCKRTIFHLSQLTNIDSTLDEEICGMLTTSYLYLNLAQKAKYWASRWISTNGCKHTQAVPILVDSHILLKEFSEARKCLKPWLQKYPKDPGLVQSRKVLQKKESEHLAAQAAAKK